MAFKLPPAIYSPELMQSVSYELDQYVEWYRDSRIKAKVGAPAAPEPVLSAETALAVQAWYADGAKPTVAGLAELAATLREMKPPVVHILLAALPNHAQRAQLVDWFRANTAPDTLVAFVADRNLGGGVVVRTPNRIFDDSWKLRLVAGRDKLPEIIHAV